MLRFIISLTLIVAIAIPGICQRKYEIQGTISTSPSQSASLRIRLLSSLDTLVAQTDSTGYFHFSKVKLTEFLLEIRREDSLLFSKTYRIEDNVNGIFQIGPITLTDPAQLAEVTVIAPQIIVKEDTIEYKVSAYQVREGAPVEDVIKKLPGVTVDQEGNITAQGKKVIKVKVNGKDFFGGDVQTATQNLPANIINNIQIIDDYGDQANLNGIKTGEPEKVININTKKDKNRGLFGNINLAVGTDDRYLAGLTLNRFKDEQQISFVGSANNTNASNFNFGSGGTGAANGGNGVTIVQSAGLNYRDKWSKKTVHRFHKACFYGERI